MAIGYACSTVGVHGIKFKKFRNENTKIETIKELISFNLLSLDKMLAYNIKNDIRLFRLCSDIIPINLLFVNIAKSLEIFDKELSILAKKIKENQIRFSMYPIHNVELSSPKDELVKKSIVELSYYNRFLDALNLDKTSKIILHIGEVYGDKKKAINRFIENYKSLDQTVKSRIVIENDDKILNIEETLNLAKTLKIPVLYNNINNSVNPSTDKSDKYWINQAKKTWNKEDGKQMIHYCQQAYGKKLGSSSITIDVKEFHKFYNEIEGSKIDIILEAKDKNLSAIKCKNTVEKFNIGQLEKEWARYKYLVLEHSPQIYNEIRFLLKDKNTYPVEKFYELVDESLAKEPVEKYIINAGDHVWGYFRKRESETSRKNIDEFYKDIENGGTTKPLKTYLWNLSRKYEEKYLLESLYFIDIL